MRIVLILLMCVSFAYGQNDTTKYFISKDYGWQWNRGKFKMLVLPTDTTNNKLGVAQLSNGLYYGNGSKWSAVSNIDTSFLSRYYRKNQTDSAINANVPIYDLQDITSNGYTTTDSIIAASFKRIGGTSSQFLKANGSIDNNTYLTSAVTSLTTTGSSGAATLSSNVLNIPTPTVSGLGGIDSIRLVNTGVIFTTPAAFVKSATTGVITQTLATQTANKVLASPNGSSGTPTFRSLVNADLPKRIDSSSRTYAENITYTGVTAPSGTSNHTYEWSQNGRVVNFRFNILWGTAGSYNTAASLPFPSDMPAVAIVSGFTVSGLSRMYPLSCNGGNTTTVVNTLSAAIIYNGGTPVVNVNSSAQNLAVLQISGFYFTNN